MTARHVVRATLFGCIAIRAGSAQKLARPTIDTVNHHIVRVMNSGPTAWTDTSGWRLVLERTVQPKEGAPGMFEKPTQLILLADGRLIVSQRNPVLVRLYDATGKFVRDIGRDGEGPGEFRSPQMALYHDTLVVHDARLGRAALLTVDGKFIRQFLTGIRHDGPAISVDDRGRLRIQNSRQSVSLFQPQWVYLDLTGKHLDSLLPPELAHTRNWQVKFPNGGVSSTSVPFSPYNVYAFRADGSVQYGGTDRYVFLQTTNGVDTTRIFGRSDVKPLPIPSATRDSTFRQSTSRNKDLAAVASLGDLPRTYSIWGWMSVDGNGNTWVVPGGVPWEATRTFDVFDPAGRFLGAVPAPFSGFNFASWSRDRVAVLDYDADQLPRVRIFMIDRRGK